MASSIQTPFTGDATADELLSNDGLALLVGMLLDQQVPMEWAFRGPLELKQRLGTLEPAAVAAMDPDAVARAFVCECGDPACLQELTVTVADAARGPVVSPGHG